jgi:hypothetical protein
MITNDTIRGYCGIHELLHSGACPNCGPNVITTPAMPSYGYCKRHGNAHAGAPCAECAAEQQAAQDIQTRLSTHHSLWMKQRHDIEQLQAAEDRQDRALTELESDVADINKFYDKFAELERDFKTLSGQVAKLLREQQGRYVV